MKKYTFEEIKNNGWLLYEFIRGSVSHGINTPLSDIDYGGIYMSPVEQLIGLGDNYQPHIQDETHDTVWYELNKFMELICKSNPTALESLFVDKEHIIYEHPIMTELKKNRDAFVTQASFPAFFGYADAQISRARGLNKKIVQPILERKMPIDFCYTPFEQGSQNITTWLEKRGLKQRYCGLVSINNMPGCYGLYYDWGNHILNECKISDIGEYQIEDVLLDYAIEYFDIPDRETAFNFLIEKVKPIGYRGIVKEEGVGKADDVRCSSVEKFVKPLCLMQYNKDGFTQHCNRYKEQKEWEKKRNPIRYESNLNKNYDAKNMCECFRLIHMGIEIASGKGVIVNRKGIDGDFLLRIKNHEYEYDYLIALVEEERNKMKELMTVSSLPKEIDREFVNALLSEIRLFQFQKHFQK